jgi:hypothetical protein
MKSAKVSRQIPVFKGGNHYREIISSGSQHLGLIDPISKASFKTGDVIYVCEETGGVFAASSVSKIDACPFCGGNILQQGQAAYPFIDTDYSIWETLLFSLLIGGIGGGFFAFIQITDQLIAYLVQILLTCGVILLTMVITKQPSGSVFAVIVTNLMPVFTSTVTFDITYMGYFILSAVIAWLVSVNIKSFFK